jgi:hypothetical protein
MGSWLHRCPWCGWSRDGESQTMLRPRCDGCGSLLESVPASAEASVVGAAFQAELPHLSPAFGRLLRVVLFVLLMFSAARFGLDVGGAALAIAAVGVVGLFTVPLIVGE